MTTYKIKRLICVHEKAEQHSNEYRKLLRDLSAQSQRKAMKHLDKAERLYCQLRGLIRDCASVRV